jgi:hypothetical protein
LLAHDKEKNKMVMDEIRFLVSLMNLREVKCILVRKYRYRKNDMNEIFYVKVNLFSSPELKAQVSFSDRPLSVVCLSICLFLTSSSEPLDQF